MIQFAGVITLAAITATLRRTLRHRGYRLAAADHIDAIDHQRWVAAMRAAAPTFEGHQS